MLLFKKLVCGEEWPLGAEQPTPGHGVSQPIHTSTPELGVRCTPSTLELLDKVPLPYVLHFRSDQVQTLNRVVSPPQLLIHRGQALSCSFHKPLCSNFPWHLLPASSPSLPFLMLLPLQEPGSKHGKTWGVEFRYSTVRLALTAAPRWLTMSPTDWRMAGERPFITKDNCYPISIHH